MRVLYFRNMDRDNKAIITGMKERGHSVWSVGIPDEDGELSRLMLNNPGGEILKVWENSQPQIVFSLGFYPCLSALCNYYGIPYVSWVISPPYSALYFPIILEENNLVFLADKQKAGELKAEGIHNIIYLPQGIYEDFYDETAFEAEEKREWEEYFGAESLSNPAKGYLDGLLACQSHVYGLDFFSRPLPGYVLENLLENSSIGPAAGSVESLEQYYREHCFYPKATAVDRQILSSALSRLEGDLPAGIKINLTPRGYRDGLYGNALQIMGKGKLLISDYRPELEKVFIPGEELLIYEDMADLLNKIIYYTGHEQERQKIALKGQEKVRKEHTLAIRLQQMEKHIEDYFTPTERNGKRHGEQENRNEAGQGV